VHSVIPWGNPLQCRAEERQRPHGGFHDPLNDSLRG
jgi:hypothetical protein